MPPIDEDIKVRILTIVILGVLLLVAEIGIILTSLFTDRELWRAEALTFGGSIVLAVLGGFAWKGIRHRRHWKVNLEKEGNGE